VHDTFHAYPMSTSFVVIKKFYVWLPVTIRAN